MIIIGDVHGGGKTPGLRSAKTKLEVYHNIVRNLKQKTIQIGDLGFKEQHEWFLENINTDQHKVLFGNHDHMPMVEERHSLGHFSFLKEESIMTIRGAASIDKHMRTEGLDWFPDEELSMMQCDGAISMIQQCKPRVVLSHDCPTEVAMEMYGRLIKSRTDQMLQACFLHHQPQLWVFGHHHKSKKLNIRGTQFICLAELEIMEI